jgi:uncharacterized protein involved in type VI secretion and phage assembly
VLVQFLDGDVNAPVITGRLYNDEDRPPPNDDGKSILHLPLGAADDEAVHVELTSGDTREATVKLGKGLSITVRDDDPVVELDVDGGKATLKIGRDGAVELKSNGKLAVEANEISLKAQGNLSVEGGGTVKVKGATVNIN